MQQRGMSDNPIFEKNGVEFFQHFQQKNFHSIQTNCNVRVRMRAPKIFCALFFFIAYQGEF